MDDPGYIIRSYREVWQDMIKEQAGADEVTRLPERQIGQARGVYVITGKRHKEAAEEFQRRLDAGMTLPEEVLATIEIEEEYEVAIDIDYSNFVYKGK